MQCYWAMKNDIIGGFNIEKNNNGKIIWPQEDKERREGGGTYLKMK